MFTTLPREASCALFCNFSILVIYMCVEEVLKGSLSYAKIQLNFMQIRGQQQHHAESGAGRQAR